ncbi:MAG: TIGR04002 family protein [Firmicutes bacterium]|nr:TIGR04002 family protein [Bacillota bacterium]
MSKKLRYPVMTALLAALIIVFTAYVGHIPLPGSSGYLHFGDSLIFLAACLLPGPYAALAGAIGAGLADLLTDAVRYALPSVIIKTCIALLFSAKKDKIVCPRNALALLPAAAITLGGYFLAEWIMASRAAALLTLPFNLLQTAGSAALFVLLGLAMDKAGLKRRV